MTSRIALFDQILNASLLQPLSSTQPDYKAYKVRVKLRILEQRSEASGEKELKFELSRSDDFEFLYAEILNNEKYQKLARELDLIVDFDTFAKSIVKNLLSKNIVHASEEDGESDARKKPGYHSIIDNGNPMEINITLDSEKNFCLFELFSKTAISKGRIFAMKLAAVRGDHLISHLLKICSSQAVKLTSHQKTNDQLDTLKTRIVELEEQIAKLEECKEQFEEQSDRIKELEDELQLVKEEKENIRQLAEDKDEDMAEIEGDVEALNEELIGTKAELDIVVKMLEEEQDKVEQLDKRKSALQKEVSRLRVENEKLLQKLASAEHAMKRNDAQQNQQSLDIRKLRELEADLKEKDSMVDNLTGTIGDLRKELANEKLKTQEVTDSFEKLRVENEGMKERLSVYRATKYSPIPATGLPGLPGSGGIPFRKVLGQNSNSPFNSNPNTRTPFRDATNSTFASSFTPNPVRYNSHLTADDTTGSTMTPPGMRNPQ